MWFLFHALTGWRRLQISVLSLLGVFVSLLDLLALLLLVPLLMTLGGTDSAPGALQVPNAFGIWQLVVEAPPQWLALLAFGALLVRGSLAVLLLWLLAKVLNRAQEETTEALVLNYQNSGWLRQQNVETGVFIRTLGPSMGTAFSGLRSLVLMSWEVAVFAAVFGAMVISSGHLAFGALAYLALCGAFFLALTRVPIRRRAREIQKLSAAINSIALDVVSGARDITVFEADRHFRRRFHDVLCRYLSATRLVDISGLSVRYLLEVFLLGGVALLIFATITDDSPTAALVSIGVVLAGGVRLLPSLNTLVVSWNTLRVSEAAANEVRAGFVAVAFPQTQGRALIMGRSVFAGESQAVKVGQSIRFESLEFDDVSFTYPGAHLPALSGVNFRVERGESIGVVGMSGAGKSTLADLVLGLISQSGGRISVNGGESSLSDACWRSLVAHVPQDVHIFSGSLAENVAMFQEGKEVDKERAEELLLKVGLGELLRSVPQGIDAEFGEKGVRLSGGQRQRVAIARALYRVPQFLVLDEATSSLDTVTEGVVTEILSMFNEEVTRLVIAHRISTVASCSKILVMSAGHVTALGDFETLMATSNDFRKLVESGRF